MDKHTHHYFGLNADQFKILTSGKPSVEFVEFVYDDDSNSLVLNGHWLRKRNGVCELHKFIDSRVSSVEYEVIKEDQIHHHLGSEWKNKYNDLVLMVDVTRFNIDTGIYVDEVRFSMDEYYLVGVSLHTIDETLRILQSKTTIIIDTRPVRCRSLEYLYGFEPKVYDQLKEKGYVKDAPYVCSRSFNRPKISTITGIPDVKLTFKQAQKLWHLLEED